MQEINIPSIQSIKSSQTIIEGQAYSFADHICKLDRILRMFRMIKSNDVSIFSEVQKRVKTIMEQMQHLDPVRYKAIQVELQNFINQSLTVSQKKNTQKKISQPSSQAKKPLKSNTFGSKQINSSVLPKTCSVSQVEPPNQMKQKIVQKVQKVQKSPQRIVNKSPNHFKIDFNKQSSAEISGTLSSNLKTNINLKQYCHANGHIIQSKILINEDVISYFKIQSPDKVTLLGVQKPNDKSTDKLYISTFMEFTKDQVISIKFKAKDYYNQLQEFMNVIRFPFALCVIGQTVTDMKAHYVKFLLEMTSPLPLVIIYNQVAPDKSIIIRMSDKVIASIENANVIQIDKLDTQINMKDKNKYKCINLKQIPIVKDRCVTTKQLFRKLDRQIIQNDQAIIVQKSNKFQPKVQPFDTLTKKEEITPAKIQQPQTKVDSSFQNLSQVKKVQSNKVEADPKPIQFKYMMHSKFMAGVCADFFVYLINEQKELLERKKGKSIQQLVDFIRNTDSPCVIGCTMKSADKAVPACIFTYQLSFLNKCPMILVRFKTLTVNKASFLTVKQGVAQAQLTNLNVSYKDIEQGTCPYLQNIFTGQRTDFVKYEGKNPLKQM